MRSLAIQALRRQLAGVGGRPATSAAEAAGRRVDAPAIRPATVIEPPLRHRDPGAARRLDQALAFLDGVQHTELLGYVGTAPVLAARVAAGVRRRLDRIPRGVVALERVVLVARRDALDALGQLPQGTEPLCIDDDEPPHPVGDLDRARAAVDQARTALEIAVARQFRREDPSGWLVIDGSLTVSPDWATDQRMVGVVKSHATLPFEGTDLECYLTLPAGQRSSVFAPPTRQVAPVHSWALRLWSWAGRDLFHGLVRVETAPREDPGEAADAIARWLLAERAPLAGDPRQDRLLYGIHDVERWLRVRSA